MTLRRTANCVFFALVLLVGFVVIFPLDICNALIRKVKRKISLAGRVRQ